MENVESLERDFQNCASVLAARAAMQEIPSSEAIEKLEDRVVLGLGRILIGWTGEIKRAQKEEWGAFEVYKYPHLLSVSAFSNRHKTGYEICLYGGSIILSADIAYPDFIRYLDSNFWGSWLKAEESGVELTRNAGVPIQGEGYLGKDHGAPRELMRAGRSSVYRLIRDYVLLSEWDENGCTDLGGFEFKIDCSKPLDSIQSEGMQAMNHIYGLNRIMTRAYVQNRRS